MSESETTESAFVADVVVGEEGEAEDKTFDAVEMMGKGAAKVRSVTHVAMSLQLVHMAILLSEEMRWCDARSV